VISDGYGTSPHRKNKRKHEQKEGKKKERGLRKTSSADGGKKERHRLGSLLDGSGSKKNSEDRGKNKRWAVKEITKAIEREARTSICPARETVPMNLGGA